MQKFEKIKYEKAHCRSAEIRADRNDCVVKALAIAGRMTYKAAHETAKLHGRRNGRGMYPSQWLPMFADCGLTLTLIKKQRQPSGSKWTPKTVGKVTKSGYFIAVVRGHVLAIHNGIVQDWTDNRNHHITEIYKVTKKRR